MMNCSKMKKNKKWLNCPNCNFYIFLNKTNFVIKINLIQSLVDNAEFIKAIAPKRKRGLFRMTQEQRE